MVKSLKKLIVIYDIKKKFIQKLNYYIKKIK